MNKALCVFLLSATLASVALVMDLDLGSAQTPIEVNGILTQDTTWSSQGSPYVFTGAVGVPQGVTLTIEAGVTVDLGGYYLEVNGTLNVKGTATDGVTITSDENPVNGLFIGWIDTYPIATGHNNIVIAYGNPTCTFEYATLRYTSLFGQGLSSGATISISDSSLLDSAINNYGKTTITNSYITGAVKLHGATTLTSNSFYEGIELSDYTGYSGFSGDFNVVGNNITNSGEAAVMVEGSGTIKSNTIYGAKYGIIHDYKTTLSATIEGNLIKDNTNGIYLRSDEDTPIIKDNTFTGNTVGIFNPSYEATITGNSFIDNTQYAIRAGSDAVNVKDNWWGTTDRAVIAEKIYDSNDDFSLGTVVYQPMLNQANPNSPDPNMCPSQSTSTPSPTDVTSINYLTGGQTNTSLNNIEVGLTATVIILSAVIVALVVKAHRKHHR
jgi:parallel beta-helix repeat protein